MVSYGHVSFFLTKRFSPLWKSFIKLTDNSPEFKEMLESNRTKNGEQNKVYKKGKDSARIRFAVKICAKYLAEKQNERRLKEKNHLTPI